MKKTLSFEKDLTFQTMIGEVTTISFEEDLKFIDKSDIAGNFYISGKYKMTEASTILEDFSYSIPIEIATIENYDLETTKITVQNFTYEIVDDDILRCKIEIQIEGREEILLDESLMEENSEEEKEFLDFAEKKIDAIEPEAVLVREKEESIQSNSLEQIKNEKVELVRECDDDIINKALEDLPIKENVGEVEHKEAVLEKQDIKHEEVEIKQEIDEEKSEIIKNENIVKEERPKLKVNSLFANLGEENDTFTTYSIYIMREGDTLEKVMDKYKIKKEELEMYNDLSTIELNSKVVIPSNNNE
ncbi:MAG: hypothetical protein HFJ38_05335 [Bacilli bacterium]|nr:hypothetical protein [Bacilli bacterium]